MKMKKFNRGVISHVGVVLSFIIFITFIFFVYIILQPTITTKDKLALLNYVEETIIENSSANLMGISVLMEEFPQSCVQLSDFLDGINIDRIIVKNNAGEVLDSKISGQDLYIERDGGELFLKIYSSEEFDLTETGTMSECRNLKEMPDGYLLGLIKTEKNIFESKIIQLIENYDDDYETLKKELDIAMGEDFHLGFTYANGTIIATEEKETSGNVFINNVLIEYISKNASREAGYLNIGIW